MSLPVTRSTVAAETVVWGTFGLMYACGGATVWGWLFEAPFRAVAGGLFATFLAFVGACHSRAIYETALAGANGITPQNVEPPDVDVWEARS